VDRRLTVLAVVLAITLLALADIAVIRRDAGPPLPPIAYTGYAANGATDVFVADEGERDQITDESHSFGPSWSPDGSTIAFLRQARPDHIRVWLMNADGTNARPVSPPQWSPATTLQWMPDGQSVVFTVARAYGGNADAADLVSLDIGTGQVRVLRPFLASPAFALSPDGLRIAQPSADGIVLVNVATGASRTIASDVTGRTSDIAWSADGTWLAFDSSASASADPGLWAWNIADAELVPIAAVAAGSLGHTWVDKNRLLYCTDATLTLATVDSGRVMRQAVTEFGVTVDGKTDYCLGDDMSAPPPS
jgi:dipeptidyl aminopeptidase/acylaminoacyl peptidase